MERVNLIMTILSMLCSNWFKVPSGERYLVLQIPSAVSYVLQDYCAQKNNDPKPQRLLPIPEVWDIVVLQFLLYTYHVVMYPIT